MDRSSAGMRTIENALLAVVSLAESLSRYATFYIATSLVHDAMRAIATTLLLLAAGLPVSRLLERFRVRGTWSTSSPHAS